MNGGDVAFLLGGLHGEKVVQLSATGGHKQQRRGLGNLQERGCGAVDETIVVSGQF